MQNSIEKDLEVILNFINESEWIDMGRKRMLVDAFRNISKFCRDTIKDKFCEFVHTSGYSQVPHGEVFPSQLIGPSPLSGLSFQSQNAWICPSCRRVYSSLIIECQACNREIDKLKKPIEEENKEGYECPQEKEKNNER